jgi:hypothetical protein
MTDSDEGEGEGEGGGGGSRYFKYQNRTIQLQNQLPADALGKL